MPSPVYHNDVVQRPGYLKVWEHTRHHRIHWFVECFAEALGVFFYVYGGVGSTATMVIGTIASEPALGSLLQVGFGYAFGILLAIGICSGTSGGHFSPSMTIALVLFRGFPKLKAIRYIIAQILGAYIACLLVYVQYKDLLLKVELGLAEHGILDLVMFTPSGPGGIFGLYVNPGANLGRTFLNEFVTDVFLGLAIWGSLDPTNILIPPAAAPWAISFAYATAIWGYGPAGVALNTARDVGGRLAAMTIFGLKAAGGNYAAIAALTNIPAMIIAVLLYEYFLTDPDRVIPRANLEYISVHKNHRRFEGGLENSQSKNSIADEKGSPDMFDNARP